MNYASGMTAMMLILCATLAVVAQDKNGSAIVVPAQRVATYGSYYEPPQQEAEQQDENETQEAKPFSMGTWPRKAIHEIQTDVRDSSDVVPDDSFAELTENSTGDDWHEFYPPQRVFSWAAPDIRYQPLYFENVALERYGQTAGWYKQPIYSGLHFSKSFVTLLNQMRHDPPRSCDYPLGFCRPGVEVPATRQRQFFGISTR
jgi:hypothetical protein